MIIGVWLITIICAVIIAGEIKYRCFDKKDLLKDNTAFNKKWTESIDTDTDELSMESVGEDFVNSQALAMRGSWRLAQNQVMGMKTFVQLRQEEYSKKL